MMHKKMLDQESMMKRKKAEAEKGSCCTTPIFAFLNAFFTCFYQGQGRSFLSEAK